MPHFQFLMPKRPVTSVRPSGSWQQLLLWQTHESLADLKRLCFSYHLCDIASRHCRENGSNSLIWRNCDLGEEIIGGIWKSMDRDASHKLSPFGWCHSPVSHLSSLPQSQKYLTFSGWFFTLSTSLSTLHLPPILLWSCPPCSNCNCRRWSFWNDTKNTRSWDWNG